MTLDIEERLCHVDASPQEVDTPPPQPEHLAEPQSAIAAKEDKGSIALVDGVGEHGELLVVEEAHLLALELGERKPGQRVVGDESILDSG